jgi:hypothetical protein
MELKEWIELNQTIAQKLDFEEKKKLIQNIVDMLD